MKCIPGECPTSPGQLCAHNLYNNLCTLPKGETPRERCLAAQVLQTSSAPPNPAVGQLLFLSEKARTWFWPNSESRKLCLLPAASLMSHSGLCSTCIFGQAEPTPLAGSSSPATLRQAGWRAGAPTGAGKRHPTSHFLFGYETQESEHPRCATHAQEPTFPLDDPWPAWAYS